MVSEKFRYQLRQEATQWRNEELITPELFHQLSDRYQFDQLDSASRNRFVMILLGLGSILLGLAAITFVAANWQEWPRLAKVILMMSLFLGVNSGGFYLWRDRTHPGRSRLGQALLILGALLVGANIALFSQMFHQTGSIHELYLIWGLAVLAMAYSLRSTSLGIVSMILTLQGDFSGFAYNTPSLWTQFLAYLPIFSLLLFLPLAYWCRSRWLAGFTFVLVGIALQIDTVKTLTFPNVEEVWIMPYFLVAASCLIPFVLWAYRDRRWPNLAPNFAVIYVSVWSSIFAFHYWWEFSPEVGTEPLTTEFVAPVINVVTYLILGLYLWWRLGFQKGRIWRLELTSTSFVLLLLSIGSLWLAHSWFGPLIVFAPLWLNIVLILLAIATIRDSLGSGQRRGFWWGMMLLVIQILSRMLEYDTGLLAKALVLFLCGIGIIAAGLWFERYVRTLAIETAEARSLPEA